MKRLFIVLALFILIAPVTTFGVEPGNPGFESSNTDIAPWTVLNDGDFPGAGYVVDDEDPTEGSNFGRLSFSGCCAYSSSATGPAFKSSTFAAGTGEEITVDWRVTALGGYCTGDLGAGDEAMGTGYLKYASDDTTAATFFDQGSTCGTTWATATVFAPSDADYYLEFRVASFDQTNGGVIGAQLDIDNVTANSAPDCSAAVAEPEILWPPNHTFHDISIVGVTDPDGDSFTLNVDRVYQDEPTNSEGDGNTCPDATGIGTDTASVRAERVGGEEGFESDGRVYWIYFTAEDDFGATCDDVVKVKVPHHRNMPAVDGGPQHDSTSCP